MIYLDNAATTPIQPEAAAAARHAMEVCYFNPSSTYRGGMDAAAIIAESRKTIAASLGCSEREIYFTSGATEANNWAIRCGFKNKKGNIVVSAGEHACVYETAKYLKSRGHDVRFAPLNPSGTVDRAALLAAVDGDTCLVSVIHASNETGVLNDIAGLAAAVKAKNPRALFHSDGVQAYLKTNFIVSGAVDIYSVSGHKVGAMKGVGALYIASDVHIAPLMYGGGQERGMRSGTENVPAIASFGAAVKAASFSPRTYDGSALLKKSELLIDRLKTAENVTVVGDASCTGAIVAISVDGVKAEIVQTLCADAGVIIGRGSACASRHAGNRVLGEMGLTQKQIDGALRLSISPLTTEDEITEAAGVIVDCIRKLRGGRIG